LNVGLSAKRIREVRAAAKEDVMEYQPFACTLSAASNYRLGEPILVTFEISNTGRETYQILIWDTPFDNEPLDFLTVRRDSEELEYDGRLVKRGNPTDADYLTIAPGESQTADVDISRMYPIARPGEYTATLNTTLYDAFPASDATKVTPRHSDAHEHHQLDPTSVRFTVTDGGEPALTAGQAARQVSTRAQVDAKAKAPGFNGGTAAQQADTVTAHTNAQYYAAVAAQQLRTTPGNSNALYKEWFGAFDQARYDAVTKHFTDISHVLDTEQVTYDLTGTDCQPSYFAHTYKGARTVWLCGLYLSASQTGTDCKFGTLDHEWSHAVCGTEDNAYRESGCRDLAISDPSKAVNNADSHEYFAEHLYRTTTHLDAPLNAITRNGQLDVFWIGPDSAVATTWADADGSPWRTPFPVTPPAAARVNAPLTAVTRNDQLHVFWIGSDSAVASTWADADGSPWRTPFPVTPPAAARVDAPLTAVTRNDQLHVFWIGPDGAIASTWADTDGSPWRTPFPVTPPAAARVDAPLTAVTRNGQLHVFWIGLDGAIASTWADADGSPWRTPFPVTPPAAARVDAPLTAVTRNDQLHVFWIGPDGAIASTWADADGSPWRTSFPVTPPAAARVDAPLTAVTRNDQLHVFWIGPDGAIASTWADTDGSPWHTPFPITSP
jgi:hypothetical protein